MPKFYWTDDRCRLAKQMWAAGASSRAIAIALGCSEKSFRNYVGRARLHRFAKPQPFVTDGSRAGLTREAVAYLDGLEAAYTASGRADKAAEVRADMVMMQRVAINLNLIFARS